MAFKILSPEESKKRARANVAEWLRQKEIEEKKASIEKRKAKAETGKEKPEHPRSDNVTRAQNLEVFIPCSSGATMEGALAMAETEKRVIASNKRLDQALVGSDEWEGIEEVFSCWSGTMTAYEEAGKPFGEVVEYVDSQTKLKYLFPVPQKYKGKTDCILVAEHPNYSLEMDGNNRIIRAAVVDLILRFPAKGGWYLADSKYGMPFGDHSVVDDSDSNARYLCRIKKRVGPVARFYYLGGYDYRRVVGLDYGPSVDLGVAIECPVSGSQFPVTKVK